MQCFKCLNKWKDTKDAATGFCPSCGTNLLQSLTKDSKKMKPEYKLQYVIQSFGFDILHEKPIISGIINDLFSPNIKLRKIILISIKLKIPDKLKEAECSSCRILNTRSIRNHFINKALISDLDADKIIYYWQFALEWKGLRNSRMF